MDRPRAQRTLFYRAIPILLVISLCCAQVSLGLSVPGATCVPGAGSAAAQAHTCCCGEAGPCCCDVQEGSETALPDMALAPVSGAAYDPTTRHAALEGGRQSPRIPPLALNAAARWTGTGPPLVLSYLVNLTFRC